MSFDDYRRRPPVISGEHNFDNLPLAPGHVDPEEFFEGPKKAKIRLHPMQWMTYILVCITCLVLLYFAFEFLVFISNLQDAIQQFSNQIGEGI